MRIRSIKPEFWRSSDISKLPIEDRLLFIGLWSYVDDNGVGIDKLAAIAADLFADDIEQDAPETFARVSRGLQNLSESNRIVRYTVEGTPYLSINNWGKHQRIDKPGKARFPLPDAENAEIRESLARVSETLAPGTGEQGNRGTEEQRQEKTCPTSPDEFMDWYMAYPRKEARAAAEKAYNKARAKTSQEVLIAGAERYASDPNRVGEFTKLPATWLNGGCWDDEPLPPRYGSQPQPDHGQRALAKGIELLQGWEAQQQQQEPILEVEA